MSKKGREYELALVNDIYEDTDGEVIALPVGYSGNHNAPSPDILLNDGRNAHAFEIKRTNQDRQSFKCHEDVDKDDIRQLVEFCQTYDPPTYPYLGVRFNHRRLVLIKLFTGHDDRDPDWEEIVESGETMCPVECKVTRTNNLMVYKPDSGEWPGAGESDAEYLLETIGYYDTARVREYDVRNRM